MMMKSKEDRLAAEFAAHGFRCVIGYGGPCLGNFNGYLCVPHGHPWHGLSYDDLCGRCSCHGGVTYAEAHLPWVCDETAVAEPSVGWWLGFDTCHYGDLVVGVPIMAGMHDGVFRDLDYVRGELENLAVQAAAAA